MKIVVAGSTGLVGTALVNALARDGHTVVRLVRRGSSAKKEESPANAASHGASLSHSSPKSAHGTLNIIDVPWNPTTCDLETSPFGKAQSVVEGLDALANLAGAPIAAESWSEERKALLRSSRVHTTRELVCALEKMQVRPKVFVSASATGYYGNRGDELLTEESKPGDDFLARLAQEWEAEAVKAEALGIRVVRARFGVILSKQGGALPQMMKPFSYGLGGRLGSGSQWMSWITLEDVIGVLRYALEDPALTGAVNVVAPQPVRNAEFTKELSHAIHRPAFFAAPAFALRFALGEMADVLLSSQRVLPSYLQRLSYRFLHPDISSALAHVLRAA